MEIPGLELLLSSVSHTLRDKLDALVALIHWLVIKEELKCERNVDGTVTLTELLPVGWNSGSDEYTLNYTNGDKRYSLKVLRVDQAALIHLMEENSERLAVLNINIDDVVTEQFNNFHRMFVNLDEFYSKFKSEIGPVLRPTSLQKPLVLQSERRDRDGYGADPLRVDPLRADPLRVGPIRTPYDPNRSRIPSYDPFGFGVGDLDPLRAGHPGAGGMLFDPFRGDRGRLPGGPPAGGYLPPGSVPPGARFDPFGPDINGRGPFRGGPGPDHMRPPDFDDQFM